MGYRHHRGARALGLRCARWPHCAWSRYMETPCPAGALVFPMKTHRHPLVLLATFAVASVVRAQINYSITDLGTLGGASSYGWGINSSGQVVGSSGTASGGNHAVLNSNGTKTAWLP